MGDALIKGGVIPGAPVQLMLHSGTEPACLSDDQGETPPKKAPDFGNSGPDGRPMPPEARLVQARYGLISPYWWMMAMVMAGAPVLAGLAGRSMPEAGVAGLIGSAALLTLLSRWVIMIDRQLGIERQRCSAMLWACVIVPMACFGAGLILWAKTGGLDWRLALGVLVLATGVGSVIQSGRRFSLLSVHLAGWAPVALIEASSLALGLLMASLPLIMFVSHVQARLEREALAKAESRTRASRKAEDILREFEETGQGWFWETDRRGNLVHASAVIGRILDHPVDALTGTPFTALFEPAEDGQEAERTLAFYLSTRCSFQELAVRAAVGQGQDERWWSISGRPVYDGFGNFIGFRGSGHDLTEKRRSQEKAAHLARYDSLTGLFNRFQMSQTLARILEERRDADRVCAILLLDLDRFKQVNDTLGHPAGDTLLKQVAQRLQRVVQDMGQVGRLGGDEFEVILPGELPRTEIANLAARIIDTVSEPYSIEGHRVSIGTSVGIAMAPDDGTTRDALVRNADLALYAAKDSGRGRYFFYADDLHHEAEERRQLEHDLRDALQHGGLQLYYQPIIHTASEKVNGFEALMRWDHPVRGPLSPVKFIPIAEDVGLILQLGEWALRQACADLARWPESVRVAVNVSPLQFASPDLPRIVERAITDAGVRAKRLELEITESVFLNDDADTDAMFSALKKLGVRLALDDFGTGYSSLGNLKKAPFDKIKIDQSFVRGATQPGSRNGAIIASITSLADALGMETTAEGVETLDELDLVRELGCSHVQGHIYDKPMSAEAVLASLMTGLVAVAQGPRSARSQRKTMLRKVIIEYDEELYNGTVRNISTTGALIDGVWNMVVGTRVNIALSGRLAVRATVRWSESNRIGVAFDYPILHQDALQGADVKGQALSRPGSKRLRATG